MSLKNTAGFIAFLIFAILIFQPSAEAELLQTYRGTLDPPDAEEWQQMLEQRLEKHACMHKTEKFQNNLKSTLVSTNIEPTTNQNKVDILYYKIAIELDFSSYTIDGYVESRLKALYDNTNAVDFNLTNNGGLLNVSAVYLNGSPISNYNHNAELLTIYLGQSFSVGDEFTVKVEYGGTPGFDGTDGLQFYSWGSVPVAYTNCEPWGSRLWWPCEDHPNDKPDSIDILITHPSGYLAASNGVKISSTSNGDGTYTTHWSHKYPIATYLVSLGCTDYNLFTDTWEYAPGQTMPIETYGYPGISQHSQYYSVYYALNYTNPSLEALSYWFTLYPFIDEKYGHSNYGWGGAMEHQTLTSISPYFDSEYVIAHELGHQWAGDQVTCRTFHHMWLNEGFASYSEALYFKYHYGENYYKSWLEGQKHLDAGTPYVEDLINDDIFDGITVYDKGSWVVYMLHQVMGDSLFREALDSYFNHPLYSYGDASTEDLSAVCSQVYGQDMGWFFNSWIYQPGNPNYVYAFQHEADTVNGGYDMYLLIKQEQAGAIFPMPIDVNIFAGGYDTSLTVFNSQRGQVWQFDVPNPPDSVQIDPDEKILRTVEFSEEFQMAILASKEVDTAYVGQPYYMEFSAVAGVPDYDWSLVTGQFPYGLTFHNENTAYLDGTPTWASDFQFTLAVEDSDTPPNADTITIRIYVLEGESPDKPTLISPANGGTTSDETPQFVWTSTAGSGGDYTLQIAQDQNFTVNVATYADINDTTYTPAASLTDGFYYWHVEAFNQDGFGSGYQAQPFFFILDSQSPSIRGDCNGDGEINVSDAVWIINYVFTGGPPPNPLYMGDVNCDDAVNISDAVWIINYIFSGGPPPCPI